MKVTLMKNLESEIKRFLIERGWDKLRPSDWQSQYPLKPQNFWKFFSGQVWILKKRGKIKIR